VTFTTAAVAAMATKKARSSVTCSVVSNMALEPHGYDWVMSMTDVCFFLILLCDWQHSYDMWSSL